MNMSKIDGLVAELTAAYPDAMVSLVTSQDSATIELSINGDSEKDVDRAYTIAEELSKDTRFETAIIPMNRLEGVMHLVEVHVTAAESEVL